MKYEVDGHEVLSVEEVITPKQKATVKRHYCNVNKVVFAGPGAGEVGQVLPVSVSVEDWQGAAVPGAVVIVTIEGPGQGAPVEVVSPGDVNFSAEVAGVYRFTGTMVGVPAVDVIPLEVVIGGVS